MGRARDIASLLTTSSVLATDSEVASLGYLTNASASSTYLTQSSASTTYATQANFSNTAWTAYTPAIKGENGSTPGSVTAAARYKQLGKTVFVNGYVTITTMSPATGTIRVALPSGLPFKSGTSTMVGSGRENQQTGSVLQVNEQSSTEVILRTYNNQTVGVNGYSNQFGFFYETD
jgi:hypothetical protein